MNTRYCQTTATIAGMIMGLLGYWRPAAAVTFEQQNVNPTKFVVLAAPLAPPDRYNLVILEQLADTQPCWREQRRQPGVVLPLLLNFDFTHICARRLDHNGYSIRQAGQDQGTLYRLALVQQDGVLVLQGIPYRRNSGPTLEIGRTQTLEPGFLKIELAPGWRLTQRTHRGQPLDHIYLTRDVIPPATVASTPRRSTSTRRSPRSIAVAPTPRADAAGTVPPLTNEVEIPVPLPESAGPQASTRASLSGTRSGPQSGPQSGPDDFILNPPPVTDELPPLDVDPLSVPGARIPLGNAGDEPDVITASALPGAVDGLDGAPDPALATGPARYRFRVLVDPRDEREQSLVKDLVPDAFGVSHRGEWVLQAGAFETRAEADERIQLLGQHGFNGMIDIR